MSNETQQIAILIYILIGLIISLVFMGTTLYPSKKTLKCRIWFSFGLTSFIALGWGMLLFVFVVLYIGEKTDWLDKKICEE